MKRVAIMGRPLGRARPECIVSDEVVKQIRQQRQQATGPPRSNSNSRWEGITRGRVRRRRNLGTDPRSGGVANALDQLLNGPPEAGGRDG